MQGLWDLESKTSSENRLPTYSLINKLVAFLGFHMSLSSSKAEEE